MYDQLFDDQSIDRELADVQVRDRTIAELGAIDDDLTDRHRPTRQGTDGASADGHRARSKDHSGHVLSGHGFS
jgi:hypothetical protein